MDIKIIMDRNAYRKDSCNIIDVKSWIKGVRNKIIWFYVLINDWSGEIERFSCGEEYYYVRSVK